MERFVIIVIVSIDITPERYEMRCIFTHSHHNWCITQLLFTTIMVEMEPSAMAPAVKFTRAPPLPVSPCLVHILSVVNSPTRFCFIFLRGRAT